MRSKAYIAVPFTWLSLLIIIFILPTIPSLAATDQNDSNPVFARINDKVIRYNEFQLIFRNAVRNKYYHGEVPRNELVEFQRKVGKDIVQQVLLQQEAERLGLEPQLEKIKKGLAEYDARQSRLPGWQPRSAEDQQLMIDRLSQKDILDQMETRIKNIPQPDEQAVREYYQKNPDKFTEPRRLWVSVILLPVAPSSSSATWQNAEKEAQKLIDRVQNGESFADLARQYSSHPSSVNGGDLGYLHQDMLESGAQQAVDQLKINELTPPVRVLEGYTVFQLNGIREAKLNPFEAVRDRAEGLLYRDLQNQAWEQYLQTLIDDADVYINEKLYATADKE